MKPKIFIDGREGTTGLQIYDRLGGREDIELLAIEEGLRKDERERRRLLNAADLVFLCLPDDAARQAVSLIENSHTRVIDASTAHRTAPGWVYGFPELSAAQRIAIAQAGRVANPGCHASGFISLVYPLLRIGLLPDDAELTCFSLTGYSGGGKKMIADYEKKPRRPALDAPRIYGLSLRHKHLKEMTAVTGLARPPVFCPVVADYYKGMATAVALFRNQLKGGPGPEELQKRLTEYYAGQALVHVAPFMGEGILADPGFLEANAAAGENDLEIFVCGNQEQMILVSRFDNLGKGASGAAVQNMNLMLGFEETKGLQPS